MISMHELPFVSVIIPVYNGSKYIERCLDALMSSSYPSFEIIVVDDCSTDDTVSIAQQKGAKVLQLSKQSGQSTARNYGAIYALADILLFIDSDVMVRKNTIEMVIEDFHSSPDIVAVFGSYDDEPAEKNFISQYKNMFHHFHHQHSSAEASTFWTGCGAIHKKVFELIGGFDQNLFFIEDIELGYRIRKKGYRILLDKGLQVKHLKHWGFLSMLRTDIFQRAIPWSRLIMETKFIPKDLNLQMSYKISAISVALMILMLPFLFFGHIKYYNNPVAFTAGLFSLILLVNILILNRKLYYFYAQRRGLRFVVQIIPLHLLYYLYSSMSFAFCWITYRISILGSLICTRWLYSDYGNRINLLENRQMVKGVADGRNGSQKAIGYENIEISQNFNGSKKITTNTCSENASQKNWEHGILNIGTAFALEPLFYKNVPLWKRAMDIVCSVSCIIIFSPIMIAVACVIKLTSKGPVLFKQQRSGLGGRPFTFYKFRSMVFGAEHKKKELMKYNFRTGPVFKMKDDPRITLVGRFIRKWSIDELPQLFNVLRGDMSTIGPRPPTIDEVPQYDRWHNRRLDIKPGITCLWQAYARQNKCFDNWVRMDIEYARKYSLLLDMKILLKTIHTVLSCKGAF